MRFTAILAAAFAAVVAAQENPFTLEPGFAAAAGETVELTWDPTTDGTVTLTLRSGASSDLSEGEVIASDIENTGSYSWSIPESVARGTDYTVEISSGDDDEANYSAYFTIDSDNVGQYPSESSSSVSATRTSYSNSTTTATSSATKTTTEKATLTTTTSESEETGASTTDEAAPTEPTGAAVVHGQGAPLLALAIAGAVIAL